MAISLIEVSWSYSLWRNRSVTLRTTLVSSDDSTVLFSTPANTSRCAGKSLKLNCEMSFMYIHVYSQNEWSTPSCTWNYLIYKQYSRSCGTVVTTENELWAGKFLAGEWDLSSSNLQYHLCFQPKPFPKFTCYLTQVNATRNWIWPFAFVLSQG